MTNFNKPHALICAAAALVISAATASAHNRVVVVPLSGDDASPLANVITVAKQNGDFSDPILAMASIKNSSPTNPYLVFIAPGVYVLSETMQIPGNVSVVGSGRFATTLMAAASHPFVGILASAVSSSGDNVALSDLRVINSGSNFGIHTLGIYAGGETLSISGVHVEVNGNGSNKGIHSSDNPAAISNVQINVVGGTNAIALDVSSKQNIINVQAHASGGSVSNYALRIFGGSPQINNLAATAAGVDSYGVYASGANPSARIDNSKIKGSTGSIMIDSAGMRIVSTELDGVIADNFGGSLQCLDVYSPNLIFQSC